jgi:5-methylcytosine-specific restriction enzyme B
MTDNLSEKLEEIWKLEIEPYLEEYFFSKSEAMTGFRWDKNKEKLLP